EGFSLALPFVAIGFEILAQLQDSGLVGLLFEGLGEIILGLLGRGFGGFPGLFLAVIGFAQGEHVFVVAGSFAEVEMELAIMLDVMGFQRLIDAIKGIQNGLK